MKPKNDNHSRDESGNFKCKNCEMVTNNAFNFSKHMKGCKFYSKFFSLTDAGLQCLLCPINFTCHSKGREYIRQHIRKIHFNNIDFKKVEEEMEKNEVPEMNSKHYNTPEETGKTDLNFKNNKEVIENVDEMKKIKSLDKIDSKRNIEKMEKNENPEKIEDFKHSHSHGDNLISTQTEDIMVNERYSNAQLEIGDKTISDSHEIIDIEEMKVEVIEIEPCKPEKEESSLPHSYPQNQNQTIIESNGSKSSQYTNEDFQIGNPDFENSHIMPKIDTNFSVNEQVKDQLDHEIDDMEILPYD